MTKNDSREYGWVSPEALGSASYLNPIIFDILSKYQIKKVVDLGCGNGFLAGEISKKGYEVAGVEYDYGGYSIAKKAYPAIAFFNIGVQDQVPPELANMGPFDAVVSTEVIEHLFSPHQLPKFASGILRKNGLLILSTPYHGYLKNLIISLLGKWDSHHTALWHGGHIKFWSRKTIASLLAQNGFNVIDFYGSGRMPFLWKSMIIVAQATES